MMDNKSKSHIFLKLQIESAIDILRLDERFSGLIKTEAKYRNATEIRIIKNLFQDPRHRSNYIEEFFNFVQNENDASSRYIIDKSEIHDIVYLIISMIHSFSIYNPLKFFEKSLLEDCDKSCITHQLYSFKHCKCGKSLPKNVKLEINLFHSVNVSDYFCNLNRNRSKIIANVPLCKLSFYEKNCNSIQYYSRLSKYIKQKRISCTFCNGKIDPKKIESELPEIFLVSFEWENGTPSILKSFLVMISIQRFLELHCFYDIPLDQMYELRRIILRKENELKFLDISEITGNGYIIKLKELLANRFYPVNLVYQKYLCDSGSEIVIDSANLMQIERLAVQLDWYYFNQSIHQLNKLKASFVSKASILSPNLRKKGEEEFRDDESLKSSSSSLKNKLAQPFLCKECYQLKKSDPNISEMGENLEEGKCSSFNKEMSI